jgi:hypothetical protein
MRDWSAQSWRAGLVVTVLAVVSVPSSDAAETVGGVRVSVDPLPSSDGAAEAAHGYTEYRVHLVNLSLDEERDVVVAMPAERDPYGVSGIERLTRRVRLAAGASASVSIFQPCLPLAGSGLGVEVGSSRAVIRVSSRALRAYRNPMGSFSAEFSPSVLASKSVDPDARDALTEGSHLLVAELPAPSWSPHWLGYSSFDGVLVSARDVRSMGADVREALRRWVSCGGVLGVVGAWEAPAAWGSAEETSGVKLIRHGFGACAVVPAPSDDPAAWRESVLRRTGVFQRLFNEALIGGAKLAHRHEANEAFPVMEKIGIPAKGLLVLMIAFTLLVGPVNVFVLWRKKRPLWILWTVPAASVVACAALWTYGIASEGWRGRERTESLTVLDQRAQSAATIGWTAYYSPLTPSDGLRFSPDTECTALFQTSNYYGEALGFSLSIDWSNDQHLRSGWISARVPTHFKVRKSQAGVRERLRVSRRADGALVVLNGLGADIEELYVAADSGELFRGTALAAGQEGVLEAHGTVGSTGEGHALAILFSSDWQTLVPRLKSHPGRHLVLGTYLAFLSSSPFLEGGLRNAGERRLRSAVYGIFEEDAFDAAAEGGGGPR